MCVCVLVESKGREYSQASTKKKMKKNKFLNKNGPCTVTTGQMQMCVFKPSPVNSYYQSVTAPTSRTLHIHKREGPGPPFRCGLLRTQVPLISGKKKKEKNKSPGQAAFGPFSSVPKVLRE